MKSEDMHATPSVSVSRLRLREKKYSIVETSHLKLSHF